MILFSHFVTRTIREKEFYRELTPDCPLKLSEPVTIPEALHDPAIVSGRFPRSRHPMQRNGERGFTLPEIMIVMVILGIIATLALPDLSALFTRDTLRTSTSSVTSSLYLARTKSVNEGALYGVQFTASGEYYVVSNPKGIAERFGVPYRLDEGITIVENTFVGGLAIFNEYGQLDRSCLQSGNMTARIVLSNGSVDSTQIEVTFISGRIREKNL